MKDVHFDQWQKIRDYYINELTCDCGAIEDKEAIKFRIECINELLNQEQEKEMNHFR